MIRFVHYCVNLQIFSLQLQSGECHATCARGYYSDRGICTRCYISCATCSGPGHDQCVDCPPGWQLAAGECRPDCPDGFYKTVYGCQKCHHSCRNCAGQLLMKRYVFYLRHFFFFKIFHIFRM